MNYVETFYKTHNRLPTDQHLKMAVDSGVDTMENLQAQLADMQAGVQRDEAAGSTLGQMRVTAMNAATGGFGDEALGLIGMENAKERTRLRQDVLREENPLLYYASLLGGSLIPGSAIAKGTTKVLGTGASVAGKIGRAATAGAAEGAIAGAGYADGQSISERADDALVGGLLGGVAGGAISGIGQAIGGAGGALIGGNRAKGEAASIQSIAETLGLKADDVLTGIQDEGLYPFLIRATKELDSEVPGLGTELNKELLQDLAIASEPGREAISRTAAQSLPRKRLEASNIAKELSDDLNARSFANDIDVLDPLSDAMASSAKRQTTGEILGEAKRSIDINTQEFFDDVIQDDSYTLGLVNKIKELVNAENQSPKYYSKLLSDGRGTQTHKMVFLTQKEAIEKGLEGAGIYRKGIAKDSPYEYIGVTGEFIDKVSQNLRKQADDLLEAGKSLNTSDGKKYIEMADKITENVARSSSKTGEAYQNFRNVDSYQTIRDLANRIAKGSKDANLVELANRIDSVRTGTSAYIKAGEQVRHISDDQAVEAIKMGIAEQLAQGKTFDQVMGPSQYKVLAELFKKMNRQSEFDNMYKELVERNSYIEALNQINPTMQKTIDPAKIASSLKTAFENPTMKRAIQNLGEEKASIYNKVINEIIKEIELLEYSKKLANRSFAGPSNVLAEALAAFPGSFAVISGFTRPAAVAALRGIKNAGGFEKAFTKRRFYNGFDENLIKMIERDPEFLDKEFSQSLRRVMSGEQTNVENFVEWAMQQARQKASTLIGSEIGSSGENSNNENFLGFNQSSNNEKAEFNVQEKTGINTRSYINTYSFPNASVSEKAF